MPNRVKDPQATMDYAVDWGSGAIIDGVEAGWLTSGDVITAATWTVDDPALVIEDDEFTNDTATVWLSGGTPGVGYRVTVHITTTLGREDDRTLYIRVAQR